MPASLSHTTRLPEMSALRSSVALSVSGCVVDPFQRWISSSPPSEACQTTFCPEIAGACPPALPGITTVVEPVHMWIPAAVSQTIRSPEIAGSTPSVLPKTRAVVEPFQW